MLVLTILKIIGILLLVLLGLLFSAALLVLVVPLRYRIWMEYRESLKAKVSVSWLLKMAELKAVYDGELDIDVRALWFHPLRDGGKKAPAETEEKKQPQEPSGQLVIQSESQSEPQLKIQSETQLERQFDTQSETWSETHSLKQSAKEREADQDDNRQSEKKSSGRPCAGNRWKQISAAGLHFKSQICRKWNGFYRKMISYRNFVTNERNQRVFFMILGQSKRLVHHILPKKVLLQADIGFDDPATTGNVLAAASILYAFYGDRIQVTPYFDQEILEGEVEASGRIRLGTLLYLAAKVWFHKDFRMLRKEYKNGGI